MRSNVCATVLAVVICLGMPSWALADGKGTGARPIPAPLRFDNTGQELSRLRDELARCQDEKAGLREENAKLLADKTRLECQLEALRNAPKPDLVAITNIANQINSTNEALAGIPGRMSAVENQLTTLTAAVNTLNGKVDGLPASLVVAMTEWYQEHQTNVVVNSWRPSTLEQIRDWLSFAGTGYLIYRAENPKWPPTKPHCPKKK